MKQDNSYGEFIFLSQEMKEKASQMSEKELDFLSHYIATCIRKSEIEINEKMRKDANSIAVSMPEKEVQR